jgi:hypothetical protein
MSGNNFTCRDKYYNYGSYLRSRGYDKEICSLVTDIQNGTIPIGPITPGNCSTPTTIEGNVTIKKDSTCPDPNKTGILRINGGDVGDNTSPLIDAQNYGLQVTNGSFLQGPIIQNTDCSHNNYYSAGNHIFNDPDMGSLCSTNVIIHGDLSANTIIGDISNSQITDLSNAVYNLSNTVVDISNIIQSYNTSFSTQDLSATNLQVDSSVNFTQNPVITNGAASYNSRVLQNYGQSTSILQLDASGSYSSLIPHNISYDSSPIYSDMDATATTFESGTFIDFSNNQPYFKDSIIEMYINATVNFDTSANSVSLYLKNAADKILLDTRSIGEKNVDKSLSFGPKMFIFKSSSPSSDNSYLSDQWKIAMDISGGSVTFSDTTRLIIKQKSIV